MKKKTSPQDLARYQEMNEAAMKIATYAKSQGYDPELTYMASFRIAVQLALMKGLTMHDIITINMHYCKSTIKALEEMSDEE